MSRYSVVLDVRDLRGRYVRAKARAYDGIEHSENRDTGPFEIVDGITYDFSSSRWGVDKWAWESGFEPVAIYEEDFDDCSYTVTATARASGDSSVYDEQELTVTVV